MENKGRISIPNTVFQHEGSGSGPEEGEEGLEIIYCSLAVFSNMVATRVTWL